MSKKQITVTGTLYKAPIDIARKYYDEKGRHVMFLPDDMELSFDSMVIACYVCKHMNKWFLQTFDLAYDWYSEKGTRAISCYIIERYPMFKNGNEWDVIDLLNIEE